MRTRATQASPPRLIPTPAPTGTKGLPKGHDTIPTRESVVGPGTTREGAGTYVTKKRMLSRGKTAKREALRSARRRRKAMRMQEPEQWQQSGQASQEDSEYRTGYAENAQYAGGYESEQQQK